MHSAGTSSSDFCQTLLRATLGAALESWGGSGDRGRDAYSRGPLRYPDPDPQEDGPFVFQVKHVSDARALSDRADRALLAAVRSEVDRIQERILQQVWEHPRYYALLTNVALKPAMRTAIHGEFSSVLPATVVLTAGAADVGAMLDAQPGVRVSYPQVLGLSDLQQLLADVVARDVIERSSFSIGAAAELARVFVPTVAYNRALGVLAREGFAVLLGPPEMGKTAIARTVALAKHSTGWDVFDCRHPNDVFRTFDRARKQVFLADDAFGSTE